LLFHLFCFFRQQINMPNETDELLVNATSTNGSAYTPLVALSSVDTSSDATATTTVFTEIKDAWQATLQETDDADIFLSMGLTKASSILPSRPELVQTIEEVEDTLGAVPGTPRVTLVPDLVRTPQISNQPMISSTKPGSQRVPLHAFLTLGSAVCARKHKKIVMQTCC
jgi:hypothetical protein